MGGVDGHPDQGRRLPDPGLDRRPELLDQALGDQLADEVGDRDPGEPGGAGEVGPARGAVAEEVLEQQGAVVTTGVLLAPLAPRAEGPARGCDRRHIC